MPPASRRSRWKRGAAPKKMTASGSSARSRATSFAGQTRVIDCLLPSSSSLFAECSIRISPQFLRVCAHAPRFHKTVRSTRSTSGNVPCRRTSASAGHRLLVRNGSSFLSASVFFIQICPLRAIYCFDLSTVQNWCRCVQQVNATGFEGFRVWISGYFKFPNVLHRPLTENLLIILEVS